MQTHDYQGLKGMCLTCGFLSRWDVTGRVFEISMIDRVAGKVHRQPLPNYETIPTLPYCIRGCAVIESDDEENYRRTPFTQEKDEIALAALRRSKECLRWYPHTTGLSPQAHLEEQRAFEFEERREAFELKMEQDRRHFELELANRLEQSEEHRHSMMGWVAKIGVILIAIEILAVILGASPGSLLGDCLGLD